MRSDTAPAPDAVFPQQTTGDQWFDEAQFESYRRLGQLSAHRVFDDVTPISAERELTLYDVERIFEGVLRARNEKETDEGTP